MRHSTLDVLRAISIVTVVVTHGVMHFLPDMVDPTRMTAPWQWAVWWLFSANLGVSLFFVLSGYLIAQQLQTGLTVRDFFVHRIAKVYPTYLLLIAGYVATRSLEPAHAWVFSASLQNTGLIPPLSHPAHLWSIAVEVQFYLLAPLLAARGTVFFKLGWVFAVWLLVFVGTLFLGASAWETRDDAPDTLPTLLALLYTHLLTNLPAMLFGIWLQRQYGQLQRDERSILTRPTIAALLVVASMGLMGWLRLQATPRHQYTDALGSPDTFMMLLGMVVLFSVHAALFAKLVLSVHHRIAFNRTNPLALASYQWYLVHPLLLSAAVWEGVGIESASLKFWVYLFASFALALVLQRTVEEPIRRYIVSRCCVR